MAAGLLHDNINSTRSTDASNASFFDEMAYSRFVIDEEVDKYRIFTGGYDKPLETVELHCSR